MIGILSVTIGILLVNSVLNSALQGLGDGVSNDGVSYYVAMGGKDDDNTDCSSSNPCQTLSNALDKISEEGEDSITIKAGGLYDSSYLISSSYQIQKSVKISGESGSSGAYGDAYVTRSPAATSTKDCLTSANACDSIATALAIASTIYLKVSGDGTAYEVDKLAGTITHTMQVAGTDSPKTTLTPSSSTTTALFTVNTPAVVSVSKIGRASCRERV